MTRQIFFSFLSKLFLVHQNKNCPHWATLKKKNMVKDTIWFQHFSCQDTKKAFHKMIQCHKIARLIFFCHNSVLYFNCYTFPSFVLTYTVVSERDTLWKDLWGNKGSIQINSLTSWNPILHCFKNVLKSKISNWKRLKSGSVKSRRVNSSGRKKKQFSLKIFMTKRTIAGCAFRVNIIVAASYDKWYI